MRIDDVTIGDLYAPAMLRPRKAGGCVQALDVRVNGRRREVWGQAVHPETREAARINTQTGEHDPDGTPIPPRFYQAVDLQLWAEAAEAADQAEAETKRLGGIASRLLGELDALGVAAAVDYGDGGSFVVQLSTDDDAERLASALTRGRHD